ncbi:MULTISPECIES: HAD family phosphatase [Asticcacaulis]|uniref:HAD family hydrolase n=1 Tax=Asticcacaulis TaxID=76890 RepID=UPI001AE3E686|nr:MULTISPECIES: HAD family phosphatase [Asticcacaulis]MBP2158777.1 beta-phosphoglucomutase-like phosphatase (HAD superfamily) [Asticcacaulis solisilvae]MDR6799823.1 beta-phosphoglucomutase-like phosphatase (HAD superfamily) [Asticcacaulis sp. BE141]
MDSAGTAPFAGVILDLDGLLLDTERWAVARGPDLFGAHGLGFSTAFFHSLIGLTDVEGARRMSEAAGRPVSPDFVDRVWKDAMMQAGHPIPLRPGVDAFLDALDAKGLPRAIATNSLTERAEWKLGSVGLLGRVGPVVGRDQVRQGKPAPDLYVEAARRLGLEPRQCAALDDSDPGVRAAVAAGIRTVVQVPDMAPSVEFLAHHQAVSLEAARHALGF